MFFSCRSRPSHMRQSHLGKRILSPARNARRCGLHAKRAFDLMMRSPGTSPSPPITSPSIIGISYHYIGWYICPSMVRILPLQQIHIRFQKTNHIWKAERTSQQARRLAERTTAHKPCAAPITISPASTRPPSRTWATVLPPAWETWKALAVLWLARASFSVSP